MEQNQIARLLRKIRIVQWISLICQCLILVAAAYLSWRLAFQIEQKYLWSSPIILSITAATVFLFLFCRAIAWMASRSHRVNATHLDHLYDLKERISTYIELKEGQHPFLDPLIRETSSRLTNVSALRASGVMSAMVLPFVFLLLMISAVLIVPHLPVPATVSAKQLEQKAIVEQGKELEAFIQELEKKRPADPELKKLAQEFKKLAEELQNSPVDKSEALKRINALEEKQKQLHSVRQQKLADELRKAWQQAANEKPEKSGLTADQKAAIQKLAEDFQGALEGEEPSEGMEKQKLNTDQFSSKDLKRLKEALKKYKDQKSEGESMRAEMQKALENARKTTSSGKKTYTTDSHLKDRDIEKGKGGVEDGPGTTNQDVGPSHFDTAKKGKGEYVEDRTKAEYESLYDGQREDAGKDPVYLQSQWDENGNPQYTRVRNFGLEKDTALKSGSNRIGVQNQDESAIRKERVPPSHQKVVKEYFEAIEE